MPKNSKTAPEPGEGKTYSLFGNARETDAYYDRIRLLADDLVGQGTDLHQALESLRRGRRHRRLEKVAPRLLDLSKGAPLARALADQLSQYTVNVASHLKGLPVVKRWDRVLAMREDHYHRCMLEIELVNRLNAARFHACDVRLAFLPHCLHDVRVTCQSVLHEDDHVCKGCSRDCALNAVSKLLRRHGVTPYIWMTANLRSLFRRLRKEGKRVGVLGIACVPELARGMRMCMRADVPVIGIPLDANRCARWWGQFYPNSVNGHELESLLARTGLVRAGILRREESEKT